MRLIDYNKITKMFDEEYKQTSQLICNGETHLDNLAEGYTEADKIIRNLPDVDAVEVVRCKDCKYFDQYSYLYSDEPSGFGKCEKIHMDIDLTIDDFCSYGERRKEDG